MLTVVDATTGDAERLAGLRVAAMRDSLEAVGRFDPERARSRFLNGFVPKDTKLVMIDASLVGFFVVRDREACLYLDHLYVDPVHQGAGVGRFVVKSVQDAATKHGKLVRLMALNGSRANAFYQSLGFRETSKDTLDIQYEWMPKAI